MGLDSTLYKRTYVQNWDTTKRSGMHEVIVKKGGKERDDIDKNKVAYVVEEIAYWRKANAIHKWFVDNCADGEDNCKPVPVSIEKIKELFNLCKKLINELELKEGYISNGVTISNRGIHKDIIEGKYIVNQELAKKLLPTESGFFFGSTDYDEWYVEKLKETVEQLEPYLEVDGWDVDFIYEASW